MPRPRLPARLSGLRVQELAERYLADLRTRARPCTIRSAESAIRRVLAGAGIRELSDVSKARLVEWRLARLASGSSNRTANHEIGVLSAALNYAARIGLVDVNPLAGLRALPTTARYRRRQARVPSDEELRRLLDAARTVDVELERASRRASSPLAFPREPLLRALILAGARWGETIETIWEDLDGDGRTLLFRGETTKNGEPRRVPLERGLFESIVRLREIHVRITGRLPAAGDRIFLTPRGSNWTRDTSGFRRYLHEVMRVARVPYRDGSGRVLHIHALRHTSVSRHARAGTPIQTNQQIHGIKTVQIVSQVYSQLRVEEARAAMLALPPVPGSGA